MEKLNRQWIRFIDKVTHTDEVLRFGVSIPPFSHITRIWPVTQLTNTDYPEINFNKEYNPLTTTIHNTTLGTNVSRHLLPERCSWDSERQSLQCALIVRSEHVSTSEPNGYSSIWFCKYTIQFFGFIHFCDICGSDGNAYNDCCLLGCEAMFLYPENGGRMFLSNVAKYLPSYRAVLFILISVRAVTFLVIL
jgi:hypothetical protein